MKNKHQGVSLGKTGERGFLRRFLPNLSRLTPSQFLVPPGDDAAVLKSDAFPVLSIDGLTEGTHFKSSWASACERITGLPLGRALGWKLLGSALSDLAAMGRTRNRWAMIYLGAPASTRLSFLHEFYRGLKETAHKYDCVLAGGDTVKANELSLVAAVGGCLQSERALTRSGAKPGDLLCIAGTVGDAVAGLRILNGWEKTSSAEAAFFVRRFFKHEPHFDESSALAAGPGVSALLDLSDSLYESVQLLCESSAVGAALEVNRIPVSAAYGRRYGHNAALLSGGEDYSLLFTADAGEVRRLLPKISMVVIGRIVSAREGIHVTMGGRPLRPPRLFHHYRQA